MATGSPDYWASKYALYELADKLDALDGTMDGRLTLDELNLSDVKTNLDSSLTKLDTQISRLVDTVSGLLNVLTSNQNQEAILLFGVPPYKMIVDTDYDYFADCDNNRIKLLAVAPESNTHDILVHSYNCTSHYEDDFTISPGETFVVFTDSCTYQAKVAGAPNEVLYYYQWF